MKRFLRRFAGFFTGILVAFAVFFNFSCTLQNIEETKSSVGFNLQSNFLRSLARNANDETGKIVLKAEISSQDVTPPLNIPKEWPILQSEIDENKFQTYTIDDLPCGIKISITLSILINGETSYKSETVETTLDPGENKISINLKKVSSDDTQTDGAESTETDGKTDTGDNTDSGDKTDTQGGSDGQGSTDSGTDTSDKTDGQDSSDGTSSSGGNTDGGSGSSSGDTTSGGNTGSGDTGGSGDTTGGSSSGDNTGSGDTSGGSTGGSSGDTSGGQTSSTTGKITLSAPEEKSNSAITVTATITGNKNIQQVSCIKGTVEEANIESLFTDNNAISATRNDNDTTKWTLTINATSEDANGTYTVAAKDSSGNIISETITIDNFDFTAPAQIDETTITGTYDKTAGKISLSWTNPTDADFDHVKITYTSTKQGAETSASETQTVTENSKDFTDIDGENSYYTFTLTTVDTTGNESAAVTYKVTVNSFVKIDAASITGSESWTPESSIFVSGRTMALSSYYICDHEVTRAEFKEVMGQAPSTADTSGEADNNPATDVSWYAAIAYCNKLSASEGLTPCYTISGVSDWSKFEYSSIPTSTDSTWDAVTCDFTATGYRIPTEAEWEWAARGGENYAYAGSNTADDTTWCTTNSNNTTHEVKTKKANGYGLYDMCGNAGEWCWDWYSSITSSTEATGATSGTARAWHSGSWDKSASNCDVSARYNTYPYTTTTDTGFRVVRTAN